MAKLVDKIQMPHPVCASLDNSLQADVEKKINIRWRWQDKTIALIAICDKM
jgi:hypothetical protein